jgi:hypothetical protein
MKQYFETKSFNLHKRVFYERSTLAKQLTIRSRVPEKLTVTQLVKKLRAYMAPTMQHSLCNKTLLQTYKLQKHKIQGYMHIPYSTCTYTLPPAILVIKSSKLRAVCLQSVYKTNSDGFSSNGNLLDNVQTMAGTSSGFVAILTTLDWNQPK